MADIKNRQDMIRAAQELRDELLLRWKEKQISAHLDELVDKEDLMSRPDFWDDPARAREISQSKSDIEKRLEPWKKLRSEIEDLPELVELTFEEEKNSRQALSDLKGDYKKLKEKLEELLMSEAMTGEDDPRNVIMTISSGAGGTESQDWADMLLRMYMRWFDRRGFKTETMDIQSGEEAGIKSVTLLVRGDHVFGNLKSENGIHRLVRISPFDSNKRRHTSFASVHITPELDANIEIEIEEKLLRIDTYRSSGAGGQHVNKTDSAVRITHIPTNIVVQCQNERSQHKNKATAMKMLEARLYQLEKKSQEEDIETRSGEKRDVAWGSQIRSYVFHPYKMVKDLRTDFETGDIESVMNGNIDPFINEYLRSLSGRELTSGESAGKEK